MEKIWLGKAIKKTIKNKIETQLCLKERIFILSSKISENFINVIDNKFHFVFQSEGNLNSAYPHRFLNVSSLEEIQRQHILYVLQKTGGKIGGSGGAAELLGMKRTTLYSRMKKLGIPELSFP